MAHANKAKMVDVNVWSIDDQKCLANLKGFHRGNIKVVKFSPKGNKLITIGGVVEYQVAVYDWAKKLILCSAKVDSNDVFGAYWLSETQFITHGVKHVKFFT